MGLGGFRGNIQEVTYAVGIFYLFLYNLGYYFGTFFAYKCSLLYISFCPCFGAFWLQSLYL
nr:MAG TPA: hypothetical protein [Caudoviricetes sp.]